MTDERGQATVELLALLPLVLAAGLAGGGILAAHAARERADDAARAGAMALLQGGEPLAAARALLTRRDRVTVTGRRVTVTVEPRLPLHLDLPALTARVTADAGPEPRP
jgi:hypothetical protein